jgi:hypothetical protein
VLCGDVAQARIGKEPANERGEFLQPSQRGDHRGLEVVLVGDGGLAGAVVVKSARGAVLVF